MHRPTIDEKGARWAYELGKRQGACPFVISTRHAYYWWLGHHYGEFNFVG